MKMRKCTAALTLLFVILFAGAAAAQNKVKLEIKSGVGQTLQYEMRIKGNIADMDLSELPFPKTKIKVQDLMAGLSLDLYFTTAAVEDGAFTFDVKGMVDKVVLGDLIKLDGLGFKTTDISPSIKMTMAPTGKITFLDVTTPDVPMDKQPKIPGLDMLGLGGGDMSAMLPMLVEFIPALLPEGEIAPGETWSQEINFDSMGMGAMFPRVPFEFKLLGVNNGIADIEVKTKGSYNGEVLKSLLALFPEIPLGEDIVSIKDIKLLMEWDGTGTMKFAVAPGRIEDFSLSTNVNIHLGLKANFTHPDDTSTKWDADGKIKAVVDMGMTYKGAPTTEEINDIFGIGEEEPSEEDM